MRKVLLVPLVIALIIAVAGCAGPREPKIGVLNLQEVLEKSERAGELKQELSGIGQELEKNYAERQEELEGEEEDEQLESIYQEFLSSKQQLEGQLDREINEVLEEICEERNIETVLHKENVQYGGQEITQEVIEKLDEEFARGGGQESE